MPRNILLTAVGLVLIMTSTTALAMSPQEVQQQVMETEQAFAQTMAERDFEAFVSFLSEETVFFSGEQPLVGKQAVADAWKQYYETENAPFSWKPAQVVVLESGTLALSTGPVFDPSGNQVATFTSIWRQEAPDVWRIVFDKGCEACACPEN